MLECVIRVTVSGTSVGRATHDDDVVVGSVTGSGMVLHAAPEVFVFEGV